MADTTNAAQLQEMVNPVYKTAQSCLQLAAETGDADSLRLLDALGIDSFEAGVRKSPIPPELHSQVLRAGGGFRALTVCRFFAANGLIEARDARRVLDLPCGYTARGLKLAARDRVYFGFDLPAVIDAMAPVTARLAPPEEKSLLRYRAVDATNYAALAYALGTPRGPLLATTEGLLMYLTQSELEEVFSNMRNLLLAHGGTWVTPDRELWANEGRIVAAALNNDPELLGVLKGMSASSAQDMAKTTLNNNALFDADVKNAEAFVARMGFSLAKLPMADYLPEDLSGAIGLPPEVNAPLRSLFREVYFWELTPTGEGRELRQEYQGFSSRASLRGSTLFLTMTGRLDTLTAPKLLSLYQDAARQGDIHGVILDLAGLDYVSSAGLRVMLIMRKALAEGETFRLDNANQTVQEILETTGFDTIFC